MTTSAASPRCPQCGAALPHDAPQGLCPRCLLAGVDAPTNAGDPSLATAPKSAPPFIEEIAAAFPHIEIVELIGRGGMGYVYKARQPGLDRFIALKVLPQRLAAEPGFRERFTREGRMLARLSHPNIVNVFDFGESGGFFYLTMEFVDGVNLRQAMRAGRFTLAQALAVVPEICAALSYAHGEGVLHRDIKPENILLDSRGRVKIADFGIAKLLGEAEPGAHITDAGAALGTPHYMAPEQIDRPSEVDHRADIYSLGVVFYEMLTGELPLGHFSPPSARSPLDPRVDEVVMRALARERERRQQSAGEVRTQVENLAATPAAPAAQMMLMQMQVWSGKAIASALLAIPGWAAAFFGAGLTFPYLAKRRHHLDLTGSGETLWIEAAIPLLLCLLPAFCASLLGWHALRQPDVRSGARRGAWLATFGLATLPTILLQVALIGLAGAVLPTDVAPVGALAFPIGTAFALWWAARHHRSVTGRSAAPWPGRFAWTFAALYGFALLFLLPLAGWQTLQRQPPQELSLPGGGQLSQQNVEFVAVAPHPSGDQKWWKADGSPATEGPFLNEGDRVYPQEGRNNFEFVIRTRDLPPGASWPVWRFQPSASATAGGGPPESAPGQRVEDHHLIAASLPQNARTVTIGIGIATQPWETITTSAPQGSSSSSLSRHEVDWQISFTEAIESADGNVVIHVAHPPLKDWEMRVAAVDQEGKELVTSRTRSSGTQISAHFPQVRLADIQEFRFQARPYEWVEIPNVALRPVTP